MKWCHEKDGDAAGDKNSAAPRRRGAGEAVRGETGTFLSVPCGRAAAPVGGAVHQTTPRPLRIAVRARAPPQTPIIVFLPICRFSPLQQLFK